MSSSQCAGDLTIADRATPVSPTFTAMAPHLSSFSNSTFKLRIPQAQAALLNTSANNSPNMLLLGSFPSCQVSGLKSGTPMLAFPDSLRISPGSAQCSQSFFHPPCDASGNSSQRPFSSSHPLGKALISGEWQQMLLPTIGYSSATTMLPSSSKSTTNSPNANAEFYAYNPISCTNQPKVGRFGDILFSEEASIFRPSSVLVTPNQHQIGRLSSLGTIRSVSSGWNGLEGSLGITIEEEDPSEGGLALLAISTQAHVCGVQQLACDPPVFGEPNSKSRSYCNGETNHLNTQAFSLKEDDKIILRFEESLPELQPRPQPGRNKLLYALSCSTPESYSVPSTSPMGVPVPVPVRMPDQSDAAFGAKTSESLDPHLGETMTINKSVTNPGFYAPMHLNSAGHEFDMKVPILRNAENSSVFEQINGGNDVSSPAHRRNFFKTKLKDLSCPTATLNTKDKKTTIIESASKRQKYAEPAKEEDAKSFLDRSASENSGNSTPEAVKEGSKPPELQKSDYIHVRARRGQATDSHSLAERVRREKISERMKFLQDLVPGCNKVTGKAVMLDEIINYVQSLQRQVEFLSMKLAAVNSRLDFNLDGLANKEVGKVLQGPILQTLTPKIQPASNCLQNQQQKQTHLQVGLKVVPDFKPLTEIPNAPSQDMPVLSPCTEEYVVAQKKSPWDSELQSIVQMGFSQSRKCPLELRELQGQAGHLKTEM